MIPLVDIHCHLCAGLDDGPRTADDALQMCRIAYEDGIRTSVALAHQNEQYPTVTPARIRAAVEALVQGLHAAELAFNVVASAEVMVHPDIEAAWRRGELLSIGDRGSHLLIEMPHGLSVDLEDTVKGLQRAGVRPILAHAERVPQLLHDDAHIELLIQAGCLIQVNADSVVEPATRPDGQALKNWFRRGIAHVVGSDGHSPRRRRPQMAAAYHQIATWAGASVADRVCSTNATAILHGLPLLIADPQPRRTSWFSRLW